MRQLRALPAASVRTADVDALARLAVAATTHPASPAAVATPAPIRELATFLSLSAPALVQALRHAAAAEERRDGVARRRPELQPEGSRLFQTALASLPAAAVQSAFGSTAHAALSTNTSAEPASWLGPWHPPGTVVGTPQWRQIPQTAGAAAALTVARTHAAAAAAAEDADATTAAAAAATDAAAGSANANGVGIDAGAGRASVGGGAGGGRGDLRRPALFTHVINPFAADSSEHQLAMRLTLASIAAAAGHAASLGISVEVLAAVLPRDVGVMNASLAGTEAVLRARFAAGNGATLRGGTEGDSVGGGGREGEAAALQAGLSRAVVSARSIREVRMRADASLAAALPAVKHRNELPLLKYILQAGHQAGRGQFLIYSNIDIAMQEAAYVELAALLRRQPLTPISAVREEFEHASPSFDLSAAAARRARGLPHPGHDLWAFPRAWVPSLALGDVALGVSLVATAFNQALLGQAACRLTLLSRHLTYHVIEGESVVRHKWLQRARTDPLFYETYTAWNCAHTKAALASLLATTPAYRECWFAAQAVKSMMAYKCHQHVATLPSPDAQSLWVQGDTLLSKSFPQLAARPAISKQPHNSPHAHEAAVKAAVKRGVGG